MISVCRLSEIFFKVRQLSNIKLVYFHDSHISSQIWERKPLVSLAKPGIISGMFDHSSLDSLLDPAYPEDDLARQSGTEGGVSLTNLSHDSGLTTSDSQLYAFDGVENNSFSSSDDLRKLSAASSGRFIYLLFAEFFIDFLVR